MTHDRSRPLWKTLTAFAIIYFVWGCTFFAIRVGVEQIPPLLLAALRFFFAGLALLIWTGIKREPAPRSREWPSILLLAAMIFVIDYGLLFWAEQRVPSGIAAVVLATIPAFMALAEIFLLRTQKLTLQLALALLIGFAGVAVLTIRSFRLGGAPVDAIGAGALIVAAISWSLASVLTRRLPLPASKVMSSATQMLAGGIMLAVLAAVSGEFQRFHPAGVSLGAWMALLYLTVFGSIIGFTAYLWLIHHESPTKVGTYAYVNPLVAVVVGYFWGAEPLGLRTILGTACVLVSVILITTARKPPAPLDSRT